MIEIKKKISFFFVFFFKLISTLEKKLTISKKCMSQSGAFWFVQDTFGTFGLIWPSPENHFSISFATILQAGAKMPPSKIRN